MIVNFPIWQFISGVLYIRAAELSVPTSKLVMVKIAQTSLGISAYVQYILCIM